LANSNESFLHRFLLSLWYPKKSPSILVYIFLPLTFLFKAIASIRRKNLSQQAKALQVPVVVVGNISVGGAGKTPVVIALAKALKEQGIEAGIISRGYGVGNNNLIPQDVTDESAVEHVGDEPVLIAQATQCPVVVCQERHQAAEYLLSQNDHVQVIISDDGLQHYRLYRSMEIVVIDGERVLGNGYCLPAGPLRESVERLDEVDWILVNGPQKISISKAYENIELVPNAWQSVANLETKSLTPLPWLENAKQKEPQIVAVAAIGNPQRFFSTLKNLDIEFKAVTFNDHHKFAENDFTSAPFAEQSVVVMTSKDAVKCRAFAKDDWWALNVEFKLPKMLVDSVIKLTQDYSK
jgi:tetraacyldisaccharide 4'-kinase